MRGLLVRFTCERIERMKTQITIWQYHCDKCFHVWQKQTNNDNEPRLCPKCKSVKWNDGDSSEVVKALLTTNSTTKQQTKPVTPQETAHQETSVVYDSDISNDYETYKSSLIYLNRMLTLSPNER